MGRVFNIAYVADGVWINMRECDAVTFVCHLTAGDTFTLQEATAVAGTGAVNLATIDRFYTTAPAATGVWAKTTQVPALATVITAAGTATHVAVFTVSGEELSAGFDYVRVSSTSTGTVTAILHDLNVQRAPERLAVVSA